MDGDTICQTLAQEIVVKRERGKERERERKKERKKRGETFRDAGRVDVCVSAFERETQKERDSLVHQITKEEENARERERERERGTVCS